MLLVCITLVAVADNEHSTLELKHFPFLVAYTSLLSNYQMTLRRPLSTVYKTVQFTVTVQNSFVRI